MLLQHFKKTLNTSTAIRNISFQKKGISVDVANPLYVDVTIYCRINLSQNFSNSSFDDRSFMIKKLPQLIPHLICQS